MKFWKASFLAAIICMIIGIIVMVLDKIYMPSTYQIAISYVFGYWLSRLQMFLENYWTGWKTRFEKAIKDASYFGFRHQYAEIKKMKADLECR